MPADYLPGYGPVTSAMLTARTAATRAAFLPPLRGARVLDVGCGPGTITAGLTAAGVLVALDSAADHLGVARDALPTDGPPWVVGRGSVYALPLATGSIDLAFAHALFEHLTDPGRASRTGSCAPGVRSRSSAGRAGGCLPITFVGPARAGATHAILAFLSRFSQVGALSCAMRPLNELAFLHLQLAVNGATRQRLAAVNAVLPGIRDAGGGPQDVLAALAPHLMHRTRRGSRPPERSRV